MYKIMLTDDAGFMRKMVQNHLSSVGYKNFVEASDGAQAVEVYQEEKPDLVLMDITMPNMSGLEALEAIRKIDPTAKVIMCSAMGQETMVMDAIRLGAMDFIVKPFKKEKIIETVSKIIPL